MADRFVLPMLPRDVTAEMPLPEALRKKGERMQQRQAEKDAAMKQARKERETRRAELRVRTEKYAQEYADGRANLKKLKLEAAAQGGFYREDEPRVIFAIRLHGINKLAPKPKKILQLFRLRQLNNGVFIKVNKATMEMIKVIAPFVTFGYPSLKTIRELISKRGYCRVGRRGAWSRKRIDSDEIVSQNLGQFGIHGVEDVVHELFTCGPHFKEVNAFLWPFKLSSPRGGFVSKRHGFCEPVGGDWGNRERLINRLVAKMN